MSQSFSILSYNIQAGIGTQRAHHYVTRAHHQLLPTRAKTHRLKSIGRFLSDFDVVCLQEVDPGGRRAGFINQGEILQAASQHPHHVFQENRTVRAISRHGNAILSRFEIHHHEDLKLPGRMGGRGALLVELDMMPETVIVCAHLSLGPNDQTEQLEYLADQLNQPRYARARRIMCGDLNCGVGSSPLSQFKAMSGLRPLTQMKHKTYPSWSPRQGLDHILSDEDGTDHAVEVEPVGWSDHLPVSARFKRSDPAD